MRVRNLIYLFLFVSVIFIVRLITMYCNYYSFHCKLHYSALCFMRLSFAKTPNKLRFLSLPRIDVYTAFCRKTEHNRLQSRPLIDTEGMCATAVRLMRNARHRREEALSCDIRLVTIENRITHIGRLISGPRLGLVSVTFHDAFAVFTCHLLRSDISLSLPLSRFHLYPSVRRLARLRHAAR